MRHAVLTQLLYTNSLSTLTPLSVSELDARMAGNQGTLLLAVTEEALLWAAERYPGVDVYCGAYPTDPRAFHALCFCPSGAPAARYAYTVALDLPFHPQCSFGLKKRFKTSWLQELPDVCALRDSYLAARAYARAGGCASDAEHLAQILAQAGKTTRTAAFAAVLLLRELGLIRLDASHRLIVPPGIKAEPEASPLYARMHSLLSYSMEVD